MQKREVALLDYLEDFGYLPGQAISRKDLNQIWKQSQESGDGFKWPTWLVNDQASRLGRGLYVLPGDGSDERSAICEPVEQDFEPVQIPEAIDVPAPVVSAPAPVASPQLQLAVAQIPEANSNFISYGHFPDIHTIIASRTFYPIYLTGLHGIGKSEFVRQACALAKRAWVPVDINEEMTAEKLIGGFRLVDGATEFYKGPVIQAMEQGAVLFLDEYDQAQPTVAMGLQKILQGSSYYISEIGETIYPAAGFTVVVASNTKGQGDETGIYIGAQVQNAANLDRFIGTFECDFPSVSVEKKILTKYFISKGLKNDSFAKSTIKTLVNWANAIRESYLEAQTCGTFISTRRLTHFASTLAMFGSKKKAIDFIVSPFDKADKDSFIELFTKLDPDFDCDTQEAFDKKRASPPSDQFSSSADLFSGSPADQTVEDDLLPSSAW